MHLRVKMSASATANAMSELCEKVAPRPSRRPPLLHSNLCTLTADYLQSKWYGLVGVGGGLHLFSVAVGSAALTVASSAPTHLVCAREAETLTPDPLTQLPVRNSPPRGGEGQSSRVSCLSKNPVRAKGANGVGVVEERRGNVTEPCKDKGRTSKVNRGGQVLKNLPSRRRYGCITVLYARINISPNCAK